MIITKFLKLEVKSKMLKANFVKLNTLYNNK